MIEGTRPYRRRTQQIVSPETTPAPETQASSASPEERPSLDAIVPAASSAETSTTNEANDATNLGRRKWFASLIPAAGDGLVKLLRASNNLERDLKDGMKEDPK